MIDIIITTDYEIFGSGTGDVRNCLINPTEELLSICEEHGAKLTLFFEIAECWAFEQAEPRGLEQVLGYSPSKLMREQAIEAVHRGHDVQLHVHPQWVGAEYRSHGWNLNMNYWRLPEMPHGLGDPEDLLSIRGVLSQGKLDFEAMLQPYVPDYECIVLRAGGSCIQPSGNVVQAMMDVGLMADSSVYKGGYLKEWPFEVDFREAHSDSVPWRIDPEDINKAIEDHKGEAIWELPIFTRCQRLSGFSRLKRLLTAMVGKSKDRPTGCKGKTVFQTHRRKYSMLSPRKLMRFLMEPIAIQWDYCELSGDEMWEFFEHFLTNREHREGYYPLIMSGHPKYFANGVEFRSFLQRLTASSLFAEGQVGFSTMQRAVRILQSS